MRFFRMQHPPCAHIPGAKTPFREGQAMPGRHSSPKPSPLLFSSCNFLAHCLPAFLPIWAAAIDCVAQWRPKANGMFQGAHGNWKSHWMTHWETTGTGGLTVLREQCPMGTNCLSSLEKIHTKKTQPNCSQPLRWFWKREPARWNKPTQLPSLRHWIKGLGFTSCRAKHFCSPLAMNICVGTTSAEQSMPVFCSVPGMQNTILWSCFAGKEKACNQQIPWTRTKPFSRRQRAVFAHT